MTFSLYQFTDVSEGNSSPIYPPQIRLVGQALTNTYIQLANTAADGSGTYYPIRCVRVMNDDGTTGIHFRITTVGTGADAGQTDQYVGPNSYTDIVIHRKVRSAAADKLWITALADT